MGKKVTIIIISCISVFIIMSSGFGLWQRELTIIGNIEVRQNPEVVAKQELTLQEKVLKELAVFQADFSNEDEDNEQTEVIEDALKYDSIDNEESSDTDIE